MSIWGWEGRRRGPKFLLRSEEPLLCLELPPEEISPPLVIDGEKRGVICCFRDWPLFANGRIVTCGFFPKKNEWICRQIVAKKKKYRREFACLAGIQTLFFPCNPIPMRPFLLLFCNRSNKLPRGLSLSGGRGLGLGVWGSYQKTSPSLGAFSKVFRGRKFPG